MKITKSKLREIIREVIREADESDKYSHIGYGKYREKGKEDDKDAQTFQKTDSGKFEPVGGEKSGEKEKPEPKVTKIAADPFADKDSETGKDYTRKFMGTDEPDDWYDDSETAYQGGEEPVHKIATDVYYIDKYEGGGDSFEQEAVPASKISNIEDMLAADSGNQLYISKGEEGYFDGKSFTSEKGSTTTIDHEEVGVLPRDWKDDDDEETEIEKVLKTVWGPSGFEGTEDDTFEAVELLRDKGIPDDEIRNWLDDEFDASEEDLEYWMTGDEDVYDDDEDEWEESIIPQLKKEFKQYDFLRHSNNWRK